MLSGFSLKRSRSIADGERSRDLKRRRVRFRIMAISDSGRLDPSPNEADDKEQEAARGNAELIAIFGDDVVAQTLVEGIMDGKESCGR
jgi:hypothetical protein